MSLLNKFIIITLLIVICCFWTYTIIAFDIFKRGEDSFKIVKRQIKHEKQNSWTDNLISIRQPHSTASFVTRVKRHAKEIAEKKSLPATEITKSSQQIQFTPTFGHFYETPDSINSYQMKSPQQFASRNNVKLGFGGDSSFACTFSQFQQQQPHLQMIPLKLASALQPMYFLTPENPSHTHPAPFYCTYIPMPATYQFPEVPGITNFDRVILGNAKEGDDQTEIVGAQYFNPFENFFKEFIRDCPVNFYRCSDSTKCISKLQWCDNHVDCPDASDEAKCSCRERIGRERLCDNYQDCPHGEDELGCFGCPKNSFSCNDSSGSLYNKGNCISPEKRCDGRKQCANGKDEKDCSILADTYVNENEMFPVGYTSGFLYKNLEGKWYPVCGLAYTWAKNSCEVEIGPISETPEIEIIKIRSEKEMGPYLIEDGRIGKLIPSCSNEMTYVRCPRPSSGTRHADSWPIYNPYLLASSNKNATGELASSDPMVSIVGGHASSPRSWPFIVTINKNGNFHCGGAILNEWWILSAAHCFVNYEQHYYEIEAGVLRRFSFSPTQQIRRVAGAIIHERYDPTILKNDIALIFVSEPLLFNSWVRPVRLPDQESGFFIRRQQPNPGDVCIAVGWGAVAEGGADPDHLHEVEVPIISCRHTEDRNRAEICAGYNQGGRDACQGDSGGPLMCRVSNDDSEWYVGGIVSHGIGCGRRNEPGAYTKVSHFVDWIKSIIYSRTGPAAFSLSRSTCPGFKCNKPHTLCLPAKRRCDHVVDCLEAEDEINCPFFSGSGIFDKFLRQEQQTSTTPSSVSLTSAERR